MIRLGSNSTTRAMLLKQHNIDFIQQGGDFDEEQITTKDPREFVKLATKGKFDELFEKFNCKDMPLLVADTVVTSNSENQLLEQFFHNRLAISCSNSVIFLWFHQAENTEFY